jgi:ankyrin repeat protein
MLLLHLLNELLSRFSGYLESESDINDFTQTSSRLYCLLNSHLYRRNVQRSESSALIWAAQNGRRETALKLFNEHIDDQISIDCCVIPLCKAAEEGHEEIVRLLFDKGADINAECEEDDLGSALQSACGHANEELVKLLLARGASVDQQGGRFGNALQAASYNGHVKIVRLFLDARADIHAQGGMHGNALQAASEKGHVPVVKLLLERGADPNAEGQLLNPKTEKYFDSNPLLEAAEGDHTQVVKLLLDNGADMTTEGGLSGNILQAAVYRGSYDIVEVLLDRGFNVNAEGQFAFEWTCRTHPTNALCKASEDGNEILVKLLLERGADVNMPGGTDGNALQIAISQGHQHQRPREFLFRFRLLQSQPTLHSFVQGQHASGHVTARSGRRG